MLMCRFAPPLAFNFMAGIALPPGKSYSPGRDVTETVRPLGLCFTGRMLCILMISCCSAACWPCRMHIPWALHHCSYHVTVHGIAQTMEEVSPSAVCLPSVLLGLCACLAGLPGVPTTWKPCCQILACPWLQAAAESDGLTGCALC